MKKIRAILIWGVLIFAIGTYLDKVRVMLMQGGDPTIILVLRFAVALVLVVAVVLVGKWMRGTRMEAGAWFLAGAIAWVLQGGFVWLTDPKQVVDIQIHDTVFVVLYFHMVVVMIILLGLFGVIYSFGHKMNRVLGVVHFFVTFAAFYALFWMKYFNPAYEAKGYLAWKEYQSFLFASQAWVYLAILLVAAQLLFVANLVYGLLIRS